MGRLHAKSTASTFTLPVQAGAVESVTFASDTLTITGSATGLVALWDVQDPTKPSALSTLARPTGSVAGLAVQTRGALLASVADDGTIRLTSIRDPARPVEITALSGGGPYDPAALAFSPDGGTLVAANVKAFVLWSVDVSTILRRLCADSDTITWARLGSIPARLPIRPTMCMRKRFLWQMHDSARLHWC